MKIKFNIYTVIIVILIFGLGYKFYDTWRLNRMIGKISDELVKVDEVRKEKETLYQKYFRAYQTIDVQNKELLDQLSKMNQEPQAWVNIKGEYMDALIKGETQEIKQGDTLRHLFRGEDKGVQVQGWTGDGQFETLVKRPSLSLDIVLSQNKKGLWASTIDTHDPYLSISEINTTVKAFNEPWYKEIFLTVGGGYMDGIGVSLGGGIGWKSYEIEGLMLGKHKGLLFKKQVHF